MSKPKGAPCALCGDDHFARGLCRFHYGRLMRTGDPFTEPLPYSERRPPEIFTGVEHFSPKRIAMFWAKVQKSDDCWLWHGERLGQIGRDSDHPRGNYGRFYAGNRPDGRRVQLLAHRVSFELANGRIPPRMDVCHRCDNPPCVRPEHLFLGTAADNARDMVAKGRRFQPVSLGEKHGNALLTAASVLEIRRLHRNGEATHKEMAAQFGVSPGTIESVTSRRAWKHVLEETA